MNRRNAVVATALLAMGACTSQEAVPPENTAPTIAPVTTSTTVAPETTVADPTPVTTVAAPETTVAEPAPTSPPTTTIAPPSGVPTGASTAYFAGGDADGWLYLGRWTGDGWEPAVGEDDTAIDPAVVDGAEVAIHELDIDPIDGSVTGSADACPSGRPGPVISPNARAPEDPGFGYRAIAFEADWDTRPRRIEVVEAAVPAYVAIGVAVFDDTDIDASGGSLSQIIVADLDGDSDAESIVVFDGEGFSAVLAIDAQTGDSVTLTRSTQTSTIAPAGDGESSPAPVVTPNEDHRILDVLDVNGDGVMEIVVHTFVDAGDAEVSVHNYDSDATAVVLATSC